MTGRPVTFLVLGDIATFSSDSFAMYVDGSAEVMFTSPDAPGGTIHELVSPGDVTGDGVDDLAVLHDSYSSSGVADLYAGSPDGFESAPFASIEAPSDQSFVTGGAAVLEDPGAPLMALTTTGGTVFAFPLAGY